MGKIGKLPAWRWLGRYGRDRRGNISVIVALLIVPLVGILGVATEAGNWLAIQRNAQNAADSAVIAAGTNGLANPGGTTYITEGRSVASKFGFTNGAPNTSVSVTYPDNTVAKCNSACYKVTVSKSVPIYLTKIIGFTGTGGTGLQNVAASAVAGPVFKTTYYCLLALDNTAGDTGIDSRGGPKANLEKCNIMSNSNTNCAGHDLNAGISSSVGASNDCGATQVTKVAKMDDPYKSLGPIPTGSCQPSNTIPGGSPTWGSTLIYCGDVTLGGNVTVATPADGTVLVIKNGTLNLGNFTLKTGVNAGVNAGLTIIFTGSSGNQYPTGNGTLDIAAPDSTTSSVWKGVAMYKDPSSPAASFTYAGNSPTWSITGLVYFPNDNLTFKGAVNKSSNGYSCMVMVDWTTTIKGTGDIFYKDAQTQCPQGGITPPNNNETPRIALFQ